MWWFDSNSSEANIVQETQASQSVSNFDCRGHIETTSSTSLDTRRVERNPSGHTETTSSSSLPTRKTASNQTCAEKTGKQIESLPVNGQIESLPVNGQIESLPVNGQHEYQGGSGPSVKQDDMVITSALDQLTCTNSLQREETERKQPAASNHATSYGIAWRQGSDTSASNYLTPRAAVGQRQSDISACLGAGSASRSHICTKDISVGSSEVGMCMNGDRDVEGSESSVAGSRQGCSEAGSRGRLWLRNGRVSWSDVTVGSQNTSSVTVEGAVCRICHEGGQREVLVSPCYCAGTMGLLHVSCLQTWLGLSNHTGCEICNFQFSLIRKPKPFTEFLRNPGSIRDKRNMIVDICAFLLVTPLTIFTSWICIEGALKYYKTMQWEQAGLITLSAILYTVYVVWFVIMVVHYYGMWKTWRIFHQDVTLICKPSPMARTETDINSHNLRAQPSTESMSLKSVQLSSIMINVHGPAVRKSAYARGKSDGLWSSSPDSHSSCSRLKAGTSSNSSWCRGAQSRFRSPRKSHGSKSKENGHGHEFVFEDTKCKKLPASKDRPGGAQRSVSASSRSTSPKLWSTQSPAGVDLQARCGPQCIESFRGRLCAVQDTHRDKQSIGRKLANWDKLSTEDSGNNTLVSKHKASSRDIERGGQQFQRFYSQYGHKKGPKSHSKMDGQSHAGVARDGEVESGEVERKHDGDSHYSDSVNGAVNLQASQGRVEYIVSPHSETVQVQRSCDSAVLNSGLQQQNNSMELEPPELTDQELRWKELKSQSLRLHKLDQQELRLRECVSASTRAHGQKLQPKHGDIPVQMLTAQELTSQKLKSYKLTSQSSAASDPKSSGSCHSKQMKESLDCGFKYLSEGSRSHKPRSSELGLCHHVSMESKPYDCKLKQEGLDVKCTKRAQMSSELKYKRGNRMHYRPLPDRPMERSQVSRVEKPVCDGRRCDNEKCICDMYTPTTCDGKYICDAKSSPLVNEKRFCADKEICEGLRCQGETLENVCYHMKGSMEGVGCHVEESMEGIGCHVEGSAEAVFSRGNSPPDGSEWMTNRVNSSSDRTQVTSCVGDVLPGTEMTQLPGRAVARGHSCHDDQTSVDRFCDGAETCRGDTLSPTETHL